MNDIAKTNIKEKLNKSMEVEGLRPTETSKIFGFDSAYISMIRNPKGWKSCPLHAWEKVLLWINSGQSLREYSEKHGKVLPEKLESGKISKEKWDGNKPIEVEIKTPFSDKSGRTKVVIDIEVNLFVNGIRITL